MRTLKEEVRHRLKQMGQPHLGDGLDTLTLEEMRHFLHALSLKMWETQQRVLSTPHEPSPYELVTEAPRASSEWSGRGQDLIRQGKVGCLIVAGGLGSRLASKSLPKALIQLFPDRHQSLLEWHLEKIQAMSAPCVVTVSSDGYGPIKQHLQSRSLLQKHEGILRLVVQDNAPFLNDQKQWFLRRPGLLASGPDGNGHALHLLAREGILQEWAQRGIEIITVIPIDNPLADPLDPILIGYQGQHIGDVTVKVIEKLDPQEQMGIMVRQGTSIRVREYSELTHAVTLPCLGHIGLFALNLRFAQDVVQHEFPWHVAHKRDVITDQWLWKFEHFIFDMLPYAHGTQLLVYPRADVYAPLKQATGSHSLEAVRAQLAKRGVT